MRYWSDCLMRGHRRFEKRVVAAHAVLAIDA